MPIIRNLNYRNSANLLSILRLFLGLPLIILLSQDKLLLAWFVLILGAITDWLDGVLARKAGGGSVWGAKVDPLADKIFILAPILWISQFNSFPLWAIWILISRELFITAWRSNSLKEAPASMDAKIKTTLQFTSILLILWPRELSIDNFLFSTNELGYFLLWLSIIMSIISAIKYIKNQ